MLRAAVLVVALLLAAAVGTVWLAGKGHFGSHEEPGEIVALARPAGAVRDVEEKVAEAAAVLRVPHPKQVLFGDLHVHSTFSFDAFAASLPLIGGEGAHPPADACDYARFCSQLDFWSINDHAEGISPRHWSETVDSIRQCNEVAGDPADPDTVAYLGWEWTQVGATPDDHYGHKNVVVAGLADDEIPTRPISAGGQAEAARRRTPSVMRRGLFALLAPDDRVGDFVTYISERDDWPVCDATIPSPELPSTCLEVAETPAELYRKLDEWGHDSIVIPHGTTWGFYTPPGSEWAKQLVGDMHDADRQTLLEVYSGHGDSEVHRDWRAVTFDEDGVAHCPEPRPDYLPACWQAGEIIRGRCLDEGAAAAECDERATAARANAAAAGVAYHLTVPGATPEEWLDAGQCRDCDGPSFSYRPGGSAQYILAVGNFDGPEARHFRMGFMSSSDNHRARPGTGFKEVDRRANTESGRRRARTSAGAVGRLFAPPEVEPTAGSVSFDRESSDLGGFQLLELERQGSFFMTGGLIGVHAGGRDRGSVWEAMERREVYGTSGPRILLWFDLLNPPGSSGASLPMGSEVTLDQPPIFQVRAAGSFEQLPGCPEVANAGLPADKLERLCRGECYHPSDRRRPITRIEVARVRPQQHADEPIGELVDDPWLRFDCEPGPDGCSVLFTDPDFLSAGRSVAYYVRAYEAAAPAINADGVRCTRDESGSCVSVNLCGDDDADDCLAEHEPRAWSSPIWVDPA
jgi:hypothetical protein